jgi:hypothetical protein
MAPVPRVTGSQDRRRPAPRRSGPTPLDGHGGSQRAGGAQAGGTNGGQQPAGHAAGCGSTSGTWPSHPLMSLLIPSPSDRGPRRGDVYRGLMESAAARQGGTVLDERHMDPDPRYAAAAENLVLMGRLWGHSWRDAGAPGDKYGPDRCRDHAAHREGEVARRRARGRFRSGGDAESRKASQDQQDARRHADGSQACAGRDLTAAHQQQGRGHYPPVGSRLTSQHAHRLPHRAIRGRLKRAANQPAPDQHNRRQQGCAYRPARDWPASR